MNYYKLSDKRLEVSNDTEFTHVILTREEFEAYQKAGRERDNLLRINRERSNAERNLHPKKAHTGYLILSSIRRGIVQGALVYKFETVMQTPYPLSIDQDLVEKKVDEDLFERGIAQKVGIVDKVKDAAEGRSKNSAYEIKLRANGRDCLWEVIIWHTKRLTDYPWDMLRKEEKNG